MIYTIEELNRISGSRRAIEGRQYKDTKGNIYIGTSTGRLEQRSISDKYVNVKLETDSKNENLNSTLNTINSNTDSLNNSLTNKQDLLVSGENIKTINGNSILGSGNIVISSGGISDGDKGDITVSGSGTVWTIDNNVVTNAKINDVDATKVTQNSTHRFVTDTEKSIWNGKQNALGFTPEDVSNKSTNVVTDQASNTKYPSVKAVFDWVLGLGYITASALTGYATESWVVSQGYITISALAGYATQSWVTSQGYITNVIAALGFTPENVSNKENTTIDTNTTKYPTVNLLKTGLDTKQATLVSGTNIKTVNGNSLLGSGDVTISSSVAWGGVTGTLSAQTDLQNALDAKANVLSRDTALIIETDFYNVTSPFSQGLTGTAVSSGTIVAVAAVPNHPGVVALRDSTTANGGYRIMTDVTAFRIAGGEKYVCSFQVRSARATTTSYMGFFDSTTNVAPTDAACFVITANGSTITMRGRTRANNTATDTVITFNPSINTWYTGIIEVNSAATSVNFSIFNESGTNVYSQDLANLPTAAGRETGAGVAAYESTTDAAADILHLDYLRIEINRTLTR